MSNYYLQDSGAQNWQLGVTTDGREQNTKVGAQTIVPLVVKDLNNVYYSLGITTDGRLFPTVTGAAATTDIVLQDSNGVSWTLKINIYTPGQPRIQMGSPYVFQPFEEGYLPPICAAPGTRVTVWQ